MMDPVRRKILTTGAGAAAMAAALQIFAQQSGQGGAARSYEKSPVRICYEAAGSGFPLLLIAGGGMNSVMNMFPWKEPKERIPLAVRQIRSFLRAHRPASA